MDEKKYKTEFTIIVTSETEPSDSEIWQMLYDLHGRLEGYTTPGTDIINKSDITIKFKSNNEN